MESGRVLYARADRSAAALARVAVLAPVSEQRLVVERHLARWLLLEVRARAAELIERDLK